jgi:chemotaxis response regulator CheB
MEPGFEVCGIASNAGQALSDIAESCPEIILLDLAMPNMDGLSFLDHVQADIHDPLRALKVIIVSGSAKHDAPICTDAFQRGAVACFDKSAIRAEHDEFLVLLRQVSLGEIDRECEFGDAVTLPAANEPRVEPTCQNTDHTEI